MTEDIKQMLIQLRVCVAYLGEKEQSNWWPSSFLSSSGSAFLSPIFPKTAQLARVNGASSAAQMSHDEYIGTGDVYHLFRLPENIESDISQALVKESSLLEIIASKETAQTSLFELANDDSTQGIGPLLIESDTLDQKTISQMAAAYFQGFSSGEQVYPYYRSKV